MGMYVNDRGVWYLTMFCYRFTGVHESLSIRRAAEFESKREATIGLGLT